MLWRQCVFVLNRGISIIRIDFKSSNPVPDLFHFGGEGMLILILNALKLAHSVGHRF